MLPVTANDSIRKCNVVVVAIIGIMSLVKLPTLLLSNGRVTQTLSVHPQNAMHIVLFFKLAVDIVKYALFLIFANEVQHYWKLCSVFHRTCQPGPQKHNICAVR